MKSRGWETWRPSWNNNNLPRTTAEMEKSTRSKKGEVRFKEYIGPYYQRKPYEVRFKEYIGPYVGPSLSMRTRRLAWIILDPIVIFVESVSGKMRGFVNNLYFKNVEEFMSINDIKISAPSDPNDGLEILQGWAHPKALEKYKRLKASGVNYSAQRISI